MSQSSQFSDLSLIESIDIFRRFTQAEFGRLMLRLSMDSEILPGYSMSVENKANKLAAFAKDNPDYKTVSGSPLADEIVSQAALVADPDHDLAFVNALARDGFTLTNEGVIRRTLPAEADLAAADDELHELLDELDMTITKGHLDQAISNHSQGQWAAANGQLRTFFESLFDEIALRLDPIGASDRSSGESRRQLLATMNPPFFVESLGEWGQQGKNFTNGVFKRLHAHGPHPGMSDEEDCTFRLHLVLVVARYYLRRVRNR